MSKPSARLKHEHQPETRPAAHPSLAPRRYRRLFRRVALASATVALLPLLIMAAINYIQFQRAIRAETQQPLTSHTARVKHAVEFFLKERESALRLSLSQRAVTLDCKDEQLKRLLRNLRASLSVGAPVDLGVIDTQGVQRCYAGPYKLLGKNYQGQEWFHRVNRRGIHISDVFLGFRKYPHFSIAIRHEERDGTAFILRATIDAEQVSEKILTVGMGASSDAFLINRQGVLQSKSRWFGKVLKPAPLPVPHFSREVRTMERTDDRGPYYVAYSYIQDSPFILVVLRRSEGRWLSGDLMVFLGISLLLILAVIFVVARNMVRRIREADVARAQVFHQMEYHNKLASLGRLAAGVAHEINNPLAIINEKAGLLRDRITLSDDEFPQEKKLLSNIDSITKSVDRCSAITRRLLGFAKQMEVRRDNIVLRELLEEVLGFVEKEATFRNIQVDIDAQDDTPTIDSDKGQLQQVFLNIINNAFAAMDDGGTLEITIAKVADDRAAVHIQDDGCGIPEENLERIFEPFFTTKKGVGTGLGLAVTYGIVEKLGGRLKVESEVDVGTRFTVELPTKYTGVAG